MASFKEHQDNKTTQETLRNRLWSLLTSEEDCETFILTQVAFKMEFPPSPVKVEEKEEWEVKQVLDSKVKRGKLWYLVEWKGLSEAPERTTWEPAYNPTNSTDLFKDFHSLYPDQPGPYTLRV
ncbi:hypothetical protein O181_020071 [Austropuccinia psidii MF-1]|uniref:Chromo domain-containing protein n=1 Tax=Austropuccinia psidii MF-1 TaxID=1389203 RepID=A0A9Q3GUH3_9BASI|nr:hypothetical protein [Austropuccinia psidii MF-1]